MELRDDSESGVGNIADMLIKQGLVTATEEVQCNFSNQFTSQLVWDLLSFFRDKICYLKDVTGLQF